MIIFEIERKMQEYVIAEKVKPRARKTEVGRFAKVELVKHRVIIGMGIVLTTH